MENFYFCVIYCMWKLNEFFPFYGFVGHETFRKIPLLLKMKLNLIEISLIKILILFQFSQ